MTPEAKLNLFPAFCAPEDTQRHENDVPRSSRIRCDPGNL